MKAGKSKRQYVVSSDGIMFCLSCRMILGYCVCEGGERVDEMAHDISGHWQSVLYRGRGEENE